MNLSWMANNWGKAAGYAFKGGLGRTAQGAFTGAAVGAGYGMMSSDTSVLGGALMGAGLGAAGMRYGGTFYRKGTRGLAAQGRRDWRSMKLFSNSVASFIQKNIQAVTAPRSATLASNAPRSRVIKRGTHAQAVRVPPGIRALRNQTIPGVGGRGGLYSGRRRNVIRGRDFGVF